MALIPVLCHQDLSRFWLVLIYWALSKILFLIVFHTEPCGGHWCVCQLLFVLPHFGNIGLYFLVSCVWVGPWTSFVLCIMCYFQEEPIIVGPGISRAFFSSGWKLSTWRWWLFFLLCFRMIAMNRDPLTTWDRYVACEVTIHVTFSCTW